MGDTWEDQYFKLILPLLSILTVNLPLAENNWKQVTEEFTDIVYAGHPPRAQGWVEKCDE